MQFFVISAVTCMSIYFIIRNRQLDQGKLKKPIEGQPGFKYTL